MPPLDVLAMFVDPEEWAEPCQLPSHNLLLNSLNLIFAERELYIYSYFILQFIERDGILDM